MRKWATLFVAAAWLAVAGVALPAPPAAAAGAWRAPAPSSEPGDCADVMFLGVRGSGEDPGLGKTVALVADELARLTSDSWMTARQVWLEYPAADPHTLAQFGIEELLFSAQMPPTMYFASAEAGARELTHSIEAHEAACPAERLVLVGYSQGAEVIVRSLSRGLPARLLGAVLVGNPAQHPDLGAIRAIGPQLAPESAVGMSAAMFYLREVAETQRGGEDPSGVEAGVRAVIDMYDGVIDEQALTASTREQGFVLPENDLVHTVCRARDLVCDSAKGLGRVMVGASGLSEEIDKTRQIHGGYRADHLRSPLNAIAGRWAAQKSPTPERAAPPESPGARAESSPAGASGGMPGWAGALALTLGVVALVGGGIAAALSPRRKNR